MRPSMSTSEEESDPIFNDEHVKKVMKGLNMPPLFKHESKELEPAESVAESTEATEDEEVSNIVSNDL